MSRIDKLKSLASSEKAYADLSGDRMTGDERYEVVGDLLPQEVAEVAAEVFGRMKLGLTGNCLEKSIVVWDLLKRMKDDRIFKDLKGIALGRMRVVSGDLASAYGFDYNPPIEFHAWIVSEGGVIDPSLPGVIIRGLTSRDEIGPFLVGRKPVILAGEVMPWLFYEPEEWFCMKLQSIATGA